jgi:hypothetical protein
MGYLCPNSNIQDYLLYCRIKVPGAREILALLPNNTQIHPQSQFPYRTGGEGSARSITGEIIMILLYAIHTGSVVFLRRVVARKKPESLP